MANPTDDWDNWGDENSSQSDSQNTGSDWDNWGSDTDNSSSSDDSWDNWGTVEDSDPNEGDDGGFIDPSPAQDDWDAQQVTATQELQQPPVQTNFSMKTVALIIAGGLIVIALLLFGIDKIKINKKTATPSTQQTATVTQQVGGSQASDNSSQVQTSGDSQTQATQKATTDKSVNSATLVEIPNSTSLTYGKDTLKANGKVVDKKKYVQGSQIIYCIDITIVVGTSSETISYYCTGATFNQVAKDDILIVSYTQVNDTYLSITSIEK